MYSPWFCVSPGGLLDIGNLEASFKNRETPTSKSQPNACTQTLRNQVHRERKILSCGGHDRVTKVKQGFPFPECLRLWCPWERRGFRGIVNSRNHGKKNARVARGPSSQQEFAMAISLFPATPILVRNLFDINFWGRRGKCQQQAPGQGQADRTGKAAQPCSRQSSELSLPHTSIQTRLQLFSRAFSPACHLLAAP